MDRLRLAEIFVAVADSGSFSVAARQLGMTQPTVSKAVAALEQRLGGRLILRTTRAMTLTEPGQAYLAKARALIAAAAAADAALRSPAAIRWRDLWPSVPRHRWPMPASSRCWAIS